MKAIIEMAYDLPQTLLYTFIFVLSACLLFKFLRKLGLRVDGRLALAVAPWLVLGGALRVLYDAGVLKFEFFLTPWIWAVLTLSFLALLLLSRRVWKDYYFKLPFLVGVALTSTCFFYLKPINWSAAPLVLLCFAPWLLIFKLRWSLANQSVLSLHGFDATTTFVAIQFFGYKEQHVLPSLLIATFGPTSFLAAKFLAILCFLLLLDKYCRDSELRNYLKLLAAVLAVGPATRDFLELLTLSQLGV